MKVKVVGNYMHIIMDVSVSEMKKAKQYNENSLMFFEEENGEKIPKYRVEADFGMKDSLSEYGARFGTDIIVRTSNDNETEEKYVAQLNVELPGLLTQAQMAALISDHYGKTLTYLRAIENQVKQALNERKARINSITNMIEFESLDH